MVQYLKKISYENRVRKKSDLKKTDSSNVLIRSHVERYYVSNLVDLRWFQIQMFTRLHINDAKCRHQNNPVVIDQNH